MAATFPALPPCKEEEEEDEEDDEDEDKEEIVAEEEDDEEEEVTVSLDCRFGASSLTLWDMLPRLAKFVCAISCCERDRPIVGVGRAASTGVCVCSTGEVTGA